MSALTIESECKLDEAVETADKKREDNGQVGHGTCPFPGCRVRITSYAGVKPLKTSVNICTLITSEHANVLRKLNLHLQKVQKTHLHCRIQLLIVQLL